MNGKILGLLLGCCMSITLHAKTKTFTVTAYCPCSICCGRNAGGPTASGKMPKRGVTAAGPRWLPFGTTLNIPGVGSRVVQDRLHVSYDSRIDIFVRSHREAKQFGIRRLKVRYP